MAIFANRDEKKEQGKRGRKEARRGGAGPVPVGASGTDLAPQTASPAEPSLSETQPSMPETEPQTVEGGGESQVASPPLEIDGEDAQVVEPAIVDPGTTATSSPIDPGVVRPSVVDALEIEPEVIEPESIEPEPIATPAFGIADAIRLMRSLPPDPNIDLVVRVVRVTLDAVNVSVEDIMQDAARKEKTIEDSIAALQSEVADLEKTLEEKRAEIEAQKADLKETVTVRERLHQAERYAGHRPPPTPPDATRNAHPRPADWAAEWERSEQARADQAKS